MNHKFIAIWSCVIIANLWCIVGSPIAFIWAGLGLIFYGCWKEKPYDRR